MLQRIQTIYLLLVTGLTVMMYFFPFFNISCKIHGENIVPYFTISVALLTTLITIFLYKNRKLQIKLSILNIFFLLLTYAETFFIAYYKPMGDGTRGDFCLTFPDFGAILPIVSIIFIFLAIKSIKKDEKLINSADRLR